MIELVTPVIAEGRFACTSSVIKIISSVGQRAGVFQPLINDSGSLGSGFLSVNPLPAQRTPGRLPTSAAWDVGAARSQDTHGAPIPCPAGCDKSPVSVLGLPCRLPVSTKQ